MSTKWVLDPVDNSGSRHVLLDDRGSLLGLVDEMDDGQWLWSSDIGNGIADNIAAAKTEVERRVGGSCADDPREPIERWLNALETRSPGRGVHFGIWRPRSGNYTDRRFYAKAVTWTLGALHFVGHEDGPEIVMAVWDIRRNWERCDVTASSPTTSR